MSRSTPVKIPQSFMKATAAMDPATAGRLLQWGWRNYRGEVIHLADETQHSTKDDILRTLTIGAKLIDSDALAIGFIEVSCFMEARIRAIKLSKTRAKARSTRFEQEENNVIPMARYASEGPAIPLSSETVSRTKQEQDRIKLATPLRAGIGEMLALGLTLAEATSFMKDLTENYDPDMILQAAIKMRGRKIANPERYLRRTLQNDQLNPPADYKGPKAVRRFVLVPRNSEYQHVGWTPEGHPRAHPGVAGRKKVWRTDAGKLAYKKPDAGETIPTFSEDPGIYEVD